jgi:hypothetical protein
MHCQPDSKQHERKKHCPKLVGDYYAEEDKRSHSKQNQRDTARNTPNETRVVFMVEHFNFGAGRSVKTDGFLL